MNEFNPAFLRGMTQSRRGFLQAVTLAGAGAALTACGVAGKKASVQSSSIEKFWKGKVGNGHIDFANWPLYMDPKHPELKKFTQQTGITVNYQEVIQDDPTWFAKIQPQLAAGQNIGYDLMVVTNGIQFTELITPGYLAPLDHSKMPNFSKYAGSHYTQESFDPGNAHSVPWASGMTGIAWNPKYVTTPPTKISDLWDPKYKGKVGMFADPEELGNFGMLVNGVNPEKSTPADWTAAATKLKAQRDAGQVRKYYDQSYITALAKGDVWICQAWSGDIFQQNKSGTNLMFAIPEEGGTLWTDNMMIPITAKNPVDALKLIDYFYEPATAASLTEYIAYVTPVPTAQQQIRTDAAAATGSNKTVLDQLGSSSLIFPSDADYAKLHHYRAFTSDAEKQQYLGVFQPITQA
jgi:spermidine/putrescine transport system substrate-binding protein